MRRLSCDVMRASAYTLEWLMQQATGEPESGRGSSTESHSSDFTSVNWCGTHYTFTKGNQADTIRVLWGGGET